LLLECLYQDDHLVVVNKPPGILVHRTPLSEDRVFVLQLLRDQLGGAHLFPVHRLDRATSGVLVFARNAQTAAAMGHTLMAQQWNKQYIALVRGHPDPPEGTIDHPLSDPETGIHTPQPAQTHYQTRITATQPWPIGLRYPTARFALLTIQPVTGRRKQIRKHLAHLRHPIIGDSRLGDVKFKRYFREQGWPERIMLHAFNLLLPHPITGEILSLTAPPDADFIDILERTGCALPKDPTNGS